MSTRLATVKSEIHNVLSTVRLTERSSALSSRFESEVLLRDEAPIISRLKSLHNYLLTFETLEEVDAPTFLEPFLEVIRTPTSNGVVTGVALSSLNKLLLYGSLTAESPRSGEAVNLAVEAVCNCRFEASHHYSDEVVLLQILEVLVSLLRCPVGDRLTEDNVWSIIQVCYQMAIDPALSELLRAAAANHLSHVVLTVFSRASELVESEGNNDPALETSQNELDEAVHAYVPYSSRLLTRTLAFLAKLTDPATANSLVMAVQDSSSSPTPGEALRAMGLQLINIALETAGEALGSHRECVQIIQNDLCKYLLSNSQTDELPVLALTLRVVYNLFSALRNHLKVQLEVFLHSVHFRIVNSSAALNEKKELALESLLDFCHDPALVLDLHANYDCDVNCSNLFEALSKLLCKESLAGPTGLTALNVLALEGVASIVSHIAARCIPKRVEDEHSVDRASAGEEDDDNQSLLSGGFRGSVREDELLVRKTQKRRLLLAASQFNKAPTKPYWKEYARELGILVHMPPSSVPGSLPSSPKQIHQNTVNQTAAAATQNPASPAVEPTPNHPPSQPTVSSPSQTESNNAAIAAVMSALEERHQEEVASFLLTTPGLDKSAIGEFLSEKENKPILRKYVDHFDMKGLRVDLALRRVLECFRIPGEAQKIERVMECFSAAYFEQQNSDTVFASADAVFIFAFSIVMLHTDRHSRSIPDDKRMTLEQFMKNVRGINDGKDFDPQFLSEVFHSVSEQEFMLSYDAATESAREWDVVLRHSSKVEFAHFSKRGHFRRAGLHEKDMFEMIFESCLQVLDSALQTTQDGRIVLRTLRCAEDLARIATYFDRVEEFNQILILLCRHYFNLAKRNTKQDEMAISIRDHADQLEALYLAEAELIASGNEENESAAEGNNNGQIGTTATKSSPIKRSPSPSARARTAGILFGVVETYAGVVTSPVRLMLLARTILQLAKSFGGSAREGWANAVRVLASLKSESMLPTITKDDVALSSEDQRLLSAERHLFESRKSRLPLSVTSSGPASLLPSPRTSSASGPVPLDDTSTLADSHQHRLSLEENNSEWTAEEGGEDMHNESRHAQQQSSSVWTTVASFLFGGNSNHLDDEIDATKLDVRQTKDYKRGTKACQSFFKLSRLYLELIRSTWDLSEQSLAHLLTALSSPFSENRPSWCLTSEFSPSVASAFLDLLVLVASANQSRFDQIAPFLDNSFAFVLQDHDETDSVVRSAIRSFFQVCALRTTNVFDLLPTTFDALSETADESIAPEVCKGLEETRRIDADDIQGWKTWFRILTKCLKRSKSNANNTRIATSSNEKLVLDILETLIEDRLVYRSNIVMTMDVLASIIGSKSLSGEERARAVSLFKPLLVDRIYESVDEPQQQQQAHHQPEGEDKESKGGDEKTTTVDERISLETDEGDALWTMGLAIIRAWWDDEEIEGEVSDCLAALLMDGLALNPNAKALSSEVQLRRMHIAFDKVLFPLVAESTRRRSDATSLLCKFFLISAGANPPLGDTIVDELLRKVIEYISADFEDPQAVDDSKESAVQRILNIVNVVVIGTPFEEQRMALISSDLDIILPSGWREMINRMS